MKNEFYLMLIGSDTFIMLNPDKDLTNRMCNPAIFKHKEDANKDVDVFRYFGVKTKYLNNMKRLDRRKNNFKWLEANFPYFSAAYLPDIIQRVNVDGCPNIDTLEYFTKKNN